MPWLGMVLGFAVAFASTAYGETAAEQRAQSNPSPAVQRAFEHRLFTEAGFAPIAVVQADGRDVRRLLLEDPYMMLPMPGVELERLGDGRVTLRLQYRGWSSDPVQIDRASWDALASQERAVFRNPAFQPGRTKAESGAASPPPICHGWMARLEAGRERAASWAACGGGQGPLYDYAVRMVELAVQSKARCSFEPKDPFWSFNKCVAPTASLSDPTLDAKFAALRKAYSDSPGAERLAEARRALNTPGITLGSKAWLDARAAVVKFKEVQDFRREQLRQLQELAYSAPNAPAEDKAKMDQAINSWTEFLRSQELNYSALLRRLVWADAGSAPER